MPFQAKASTSEPGNAQYRPTRCSRLPLPRERARGWWPHLGNASSSIVHHPRRKRPASLSPLAKGGSGGVVAGTWATRPVRSSTTQGGNAPQAFPPCKGGSGAWWSHLGNASISIKHRPRRKRPASPSPLANGRSGGRWPQHLSRALRMIYLFDAKRRSPDYERCLAVPA